MKKALIIYAREPALGKVKTRLARDLSKKKVLRLYKAFVKDVLAMAHQTNCEGRFLYYLGNGGKTPFLKSQKGAFRLRRQTGGDLGGRMLQSFQYCQRKGFDKMVIIGTDCLTIAPKDIENAFKALDKSDCVLGPSSDGGYYLIGLKRVHKSLFKNIQWGTNSVLRQTLKRARRGKTKICMLKQKFDIDTISDLHTFKKRKHRASFTHIALKSAL